MKLTCQLDRTGPNMFSFGMVEVINVLWAPIVDTAPLSLVLFWLPGSERRHPPWGLSKSVQWARRGRFPIPRQPCTLDCRSDDQIGRSAPDLNLIVQVDGDAPIRRQC